jgi:GxxExxY protein
MDADKPYSREGYQLMAAVFEVHRTLGGGLSEEVYQESLEIELELRGIPFQSKKRLHMFYKERLLKKRYEPDLHVFGGIVVELKAVSTLTPDHEGQLMNYMRIARLPVGYLINFGPLDRVHWKRFIFSEFIQTANRR